MVENTRWISRAPGVRLEHVEDKRRAGSRHEAPPLPPPESVDL